jgi:hypothetical protein
MLESFDSAGEQQVYQLFDLRGWAIEDQKMDAEGKMKMFHPTSQAFTQALIKCHLTRQLKT